MNIYLETTIIDSPCGGGNQFMRNFRNKLIEHNMYSIANQADIIMFSSYHNEKEVNQLKDKYSNKIFVHRLDGLMKLYNKTTDTRQDIAVNLNKIADGTVFQSNWAKEKFIEYGFNSSRPNTAIINASDPNIFYPSTNYKREKTILISTSASNNINKGFDDLKFLDENLDFSQYDFTFVGNSLYKFKNIKMIPLVSTPKVAEELRKADIFISGVRNEACSNSIIEALTCNVPVIAKNSGSNPELVEGNGELYNNTSELLEKINIVKNNNQLYKSKIKVQSLEETFNKYITFFEKL